jgi:asparagine synthetase B (glutamine-hydrolysing)
VSVKNAHPFKIGKLLGAHNGMIYNHEELNAIYNRKYEVDSQHIFAHLNYGMPLEELMGYGAIEWIRRNEPNKIYLTRFRGGELAIYGVGEDDENPDGIVWSSSYKHLLKSLVSSGITKHFRYEVRTGKVYSVENAKLIYTDNTINLSSPPPEPAPAPDDEPPQHLSRRNSSLGNPLAGRHIDNYRLFKTLYSTSADA